MKKIKIGVIFGGMSTENEVSCVSGVSVIKYLDKEKYDVYPIYIDKNGNWFEVLKLEEKEKLGGELEDKNPIDNIMEFLKKFDVIFPVLHGLYGEDGTIQGIFELLKIPYIGCGILASSVGMDKVYSKVIFDRIGLTQSKYVYFKKINDNFIFVDEKFDEEVVSIDKALDIVVSKLKFPMFVKPSNSGSSVGISKVNCKEELADAILNASNFDKKILIEEGIDGREVECGVLGNEDVVSSCVGEIKAADSFYSYDAKYNNHESKVFIPADISTELSNEIRALAVKTFKSIGGRGLSRVDFFVENGTNRVFINEINTLPGFTNVSMYPKLFEAGGVSYAELLDRLVELAME